MDQITTPSTMKKNELAQAIKAKDAELAAHQATAKADPFFAEQKRKIALCHSLARKFEGQASAFFDATYGAKNTALLAELAAMEKQMKELNRKPEPPPEVTAGLARLIRGVQTKLVAKEWSPCNRWVYASEPGGYAHGAIGGQVYSKTEHYLFDLEALKAQAHLLRGLEYQYQPFAIAHHEGRLSATSLANWRQFLHGTKPDFILHALPPK